MEDRFSPGPGQEERIADSDDRDKGSEAVTPVPVDGLIVIKDGKLQVIPPEHGGRWPTVRVGANVIVRINGEEIEGEHTLAPGEVLEVLPANREPVCDIQVTVTADKMKALASVQCRAGSRFRLRDVPPGNFALLAADLEQVVMPSRPTEADVLAALEKARVSYGIDPAAVKQLIENDNPGPVVVARGDPPTEPVDAVIKYRFTEISEKDIDPDTTRVDLYDRYQITWVRTREVLAEKIPPQPGRPGKNVLGGVVPPRKFKDRVISVGEGAEVIDNGLRAVATREGRPVLVGKTIKVIPTFVVPRNADAGTGHIQFAGDVIIKGDVLDRVKVQADGVVEVMGLVSRALVAGEQGVIVRKGVIGGQLRAGGISAEAKKILSVLTFLNRELTNLVKAARQVQRDPRIQQLELPIGQIIKQLLETRFTAIARWIVQLEDYAAQSSHLGENFALILPSLRHRLTGLGPTGITSLQELEPLLQAVHDLTLHLEAMQSPDADIEVGSLQNAVLEAGGKVTILGRGCYYSTIVAGKSVKASRSSMRGGKVVVSEGDIEFRELGGPSGVLTEVSITGVGIIRAKIAYPNVVISIRGEKRTLRDIHRPVRAYLNEEGELVI